jgi:hypothetical protein
LVFPGAVPIIVADASGAFCHLGHRAAKRRTRWIRSTTSPQRPRDRPLAPFVHIQKQTGERNEAGRSSYKWRDARCWRRRLVRLG